ncbi:ferredoxin [Catenuloplanes nepalensis]|uniref:Ferredoxin n=1 Tax=Catenuloplanes nepalensis TaxID=587533 RepID=A0ABT9MRU2_9ACTN|nr:ferredoxin [Catenuloplanes nepalensis]MDP9794011.1 ferredoxin [Catenuloplanes nepalensis]
MKVTADRDRCIGAGMCALTAPAVFDQDQDEAVVVLLDETPPDDARVLVEQAVDRCPSGAIHVR